MRQIKFAKNRIVWYSFYIITYTLYIFMPITKSAKKALRQNKKRQKANLSRKRDIKDLVKRANLLVKENKQEEAKKLLPKLYKALDKTAKVGIIKKNAASRKKSRMTKLINKAVPAK